MADEEVISNEPYSLQDIAGRASILGNSIPNKILNPEQRELYEQTTTIKAYGKTQSDEVAYYFKNPGLLALSAPRGADEVSSADEIKLHMSIRKDDIPQIFEVLGRISLDRTSAGLINNFKVSLLKKVSEKYSYPRVIIYPVGKDNLEKAVNARVIMDLVNRNVNGDMDVDVSADLSYTPRFSLKLDDRFYLAQGNGQTKTIGNSNEIDGNERERRYLQGFDSSIGYSLREEDLQYAVVAGKLDGEIMSHEDQNEILREVVSSRGENFREETAHISDLSEVKTFEDENRELRRILYTSTN